MIGFFRCTPGATLGREKIDAIIVEMCREDDTRKHEATLRRLMGLQNRASAMRLLAAALPLGQERTFGDTTRKVCSWG